MNVNGMPDVSSVKQTGTAKLSKRNSKTSDNSLFQNILGQQSQGRDSKTATVQQKGKTADKAATAAKPTKDNRPTDTVTDKEPTTTKSDNTDTAAAATDSEPAAAADNTVADTSNDVSSEAAQVTEETDAPDDITADAAPVVAIPIFIIPGPVTNAEAVEFKGTMEMVAPPVIQTAEQNPQAVAAEPLMTGQAEAEVSAAMQQTEFVVPVDSANQDEPVVQVAAELMPEGEMLNEEQPGMVKQQSEAAQNTEARADVEQPDAQETGDAAEHFAAQVVKEARELVNKNSGQSTAPVDEEEIAEPVQDTTARPVEASEETAAYVEDDADKEPEETKTTDQKSAAANTASHTQTTGAEAGRIEFRMSSAQPLEAQQAAAPPEPPQAIMNRVLDQVRTAVTPDKTEFFVQLKPDYLGGLSIGLVAEDKGVVAKIMTSSQQVHNALQADMNQMVQVLRDKGINVVQMEVIYDQTANAMSQNQSGEQHQQFGQGQGRSHGRGTDQTDGSVSMYDMLSSNEVLAEQGGSVEFSA